MRHVVLSSLCAAAIGLSTTGGAFAQSSGMDRPGAPASNQSNVTGPAAGSDMNSMNKMKKKKMTKMSKSKMKKGGMEKKM